MTIADEPTPEQLEDDKDDEDPGVMDPPEFTVPVEVPEPSVEDTPERA